jgi:hypothetical protein
VSWTAGVDLYSGRPNPQWQVDRAAGARLAGLWDELEPTTDALPPPSLGHRGAFLLAPDGRRWITRGTIVALDDSRRRDPERRLERALLATAPPNLLPLPE